MLVHYLCVCVVWVCVVSLAPWLSFTTFGRCVLVHVVRPCVLLVLMLLRLSRFGCVWCICVLCFPFLFFLKPNTARNEKEAKGKQ